MLTEELINTGILNSSNCSFKNSCVFIIPVTSENVYSKYGALETIFSKALHICAEAMIGINKIAAFCM